MAGETKYIGWTAGDSDYVCTGTDDYQIINNALSWAATNPGNTIYLRGPHTYDITQPIKMGSSTVFTGDSTAVLRLNDGCMWNSGVAVISQLASVTSPTGIEISNFEIDANESHLTHDGQVDANNLERIHGKGFYNLINFVGTSSAPASDIHVHNMKLHDGMGDGVRVTYGTNIRIHNNNMWNLQHCSTFCVDCDGVDVYSNIIQAITTSGTRFDNCRNWKTHDNTISDWTGTTSAYKSGNHGVQFGNEPSSYGHTNLTQNGEVFNNTITCSACGIQIEDYLKTAGSTAQNVHIYNNKISGSATNSGATYFAGISIYSWGNGLIIENNTIENCYRAGVLGYGVFVTGVTAKVKNNNITGTLVKGSPGEGGYGVWNKVSSSLSLVCENNYLNGNAAGNYLNVTPVSEASSAITDVLPGSSTTDDDIPDGPTPDDGGSGGSGGTGTIPVIVLPEVRIYQKELDSNYYIPGRSAYINGKPFDWVNKKVDTSSSVGQDKCPGTPGWALTDFDLEGSTLTLDCAAGTLREMHEAIAALCKPGRCTIELGGDFSDWQVSGVKGDYSSDLKLGSVIPSYYHPYSLSLLMDKPYFESAVQRFRSRYIYNSMNFSSDDCYSGNLVKNSSFEDWTPSSTMTWDLQTTTADNEWRRVRYAKELGQYCAVATTGDDTNPRVMLSDGVTWRKPTGLTCANRNSSWRGLCWCSDWLCWVAVATTGTSGYYSMYSSADGETWYAKATPANNAWAYALYIPADDTLTTGRVLAFAFGSGNTNRVMFLDSPEGNWTQVALSTQNASLDGSNWYSAAYSPTLKRVVAIAYSGFSGYQAMYSDDYGEHWTASTTPTPNKKWTSITWADTLGMFVCCNEENASQQIMYSSTGLENSWTLVATPAASTTVTPGAGDVKTNNYTSQAGVVYTSKATDYSADADSLELTVTVPAPTTTGNVLRIDQVSAKLRTLTAGRIAYLKVTYQFGAGTETLLAEWSNNTANYITKTHSPNALNSGANQSLTLRYYMKTSYSGVRAAATSLSYKVVESTAAGGSTSYTYNQYREINWGSGNKILTCVAQTGSGNGILCSTDALNWYFAPSPADLSWQSICSSEEQNRYVAVGISGTGKRAMMSENYGTVKNIAPDGWTYVDPGQARSDSTAFDGLYSIEITGDGSSGARGTVIQTVSFDSGVRYVLSAYGTTTGITTGSLIADIVVGAGIVKELIWNTVTDWSQKQISFKFDVTPADSYIRVRGFGLNEGAVVNLDKVLIEKASNFELATTGKDIATYGTVDTVPDVIIEGVTSAPDTATAGSIKTYTTPADTTYSSAANAYSSASTSLEYTVVLPALSDSAVYRLDQVSCKLKTASAGKYAYLKVTVKAASLYSNTETTLIEWSNNTTSYVPKVKNLSILSATNETVTLKYYMRTSNSTYRAYATELGYKVTELTTGTVKSSSGLYLWNEADTTQVMTCFRNLLPKHKIEINADGTGKFSYAEDFLDDAYLDIVYAASKVTYNETTKSITIGSGGYITFVLDTTYPVTGIPFLHVLVKSGAPQVYIADNSGSLGAPGNFVEIARNVTTAITNAEADRLLDNDNSLQLQSLTKFYVKITPYSTNTVELGSLLISADLSTVDAERFKIFAGGKANTIGASVVGKSSCIATLRYRDLDPAA